MKALEIIPNKLSTEIICIIDKSGSMSSIKSDAIGGFNEFLSEQKKLQDDTKITLNLFDSKFKPMYNSISLNEATELTEENYIPSSMTALYDAVGLSIDEAKERFDENPDIKPDRVLVVILTDGEENTSKEYDQKRIFEMIDEQSKNDWEFIFLAANQDAMKTAKTMNIKTGNSMTFAASGSGMKDVYSKVSSTVTSYRSSNLTSSDSLMNDVNTNKTDK